MKSISKEGNEFCKHLFPAFVSNIPHSPQQYKHIKQQALLRSTQLPNVFALPTV
jgi:hypothetical protein